MSPDSYSYVSDGEFDAIRFECLLRTAYRAQHGATSLIDVPPFYYTAEGVS